MLARGLITLSVLSLLSVVAQGGDNLIKEWSNPGGGGYSIDQGDRRVTITAPGTYKFEGLDVDPNDPNTVLGLGWINHITLDGNCPAGTVNVYVLRKPEEGGGDGALGVGEINLVLTGVTGNVMDVSTTVNLAYLDKIQAGTIDGQVTTGSILHDIVIDSLTTGGIIVCASSFDHHLTVSDDLAGYAQFLSLGQSAEIRVTGELSGALNTTEDMRGLIAAHILSGLVEISRDFAGGLEADYFLEGALLKVNQNMGVTAAATLSIVGSLDGQIYVAGNAESVSFSAWAIGPTGAFTVVGSVDGASLSVTGAIEGQITVGAEASHMDIVADYVYATGLVNVTGPAYAVSVTVDGWMAGHIDFSDFWGSVSIGANVAFGAELHFAGEAHAYNQGDAIRIGWSSGWTYDAVAGQVIVQGGLYMPLEVGPVTLTGYLSLSKVASTSSLVLHGTLSGTLEVARLDGESLDGPCTIGPLEGSLFLGGDVTADVQVDEVLTTGIIQVVGDVAANHQIAAHGDIAGTVEIGQLSGTLDVVEWLTSDGVIDVGDVSGLLKCRDGAAGSINVGNVTGTVDVGGPMPTRSDTTARISVDGSIGSSGAIVVGDLTDPGDANNPLSGGYVVVNGSLQSGGQIIAHYGLASDTAFIAINYAGGATYTWEPNAPVTLEHGSNPDEVFYGNTPDRRIWESSACRADLNGDQVVDLNDANPFIEALQSTGPYAYSVDYPGLGGTAADNYQGGSRTWHGDANCDGTFDVQDVNPFIALVYSGCCTPDCSGCDGGRGDGGEGYPPEWPAPEELASDLAANVWPELFDGLLTIVLDAIDAAPDEGTQAYWQAVYAALTQ
jgi:hypothetical protein